MDLFSLANQNSVNLKQRYDELRFTLKSKEQNERFNEIENILSNWRISINITLERLFKFLQLGEYKNIFSVKQDELKKLLEMNINTKISKEEAIKRHLKRFSNLRIRFNQEFDNSDEFKYGAFNIGGAGIERFGEFCLVIAQDFCCKYYSCLAFLKEDSLNYFNMGEIEIGRLANDLSNRECAPYLIILKYSDMLDNISPESLPSLICNNKDYVEAIIKDKILLDHIEYVRLFELYYNYFKDILYKAYISQADEFERMKLTIYESVFRILKEKNIKLLLI